MGQRFHLSNSMHSALLSFFNFSDDFNTQTEIESLVLESDVIDREMKDLKDMENFIYDRDKSEIMGSDEWKETRNL